MVTPFPASSWSGLAAGCLEVGSVEAAFGLPGTAAAVALAALATIAAVVVVVVHGEVRILVGSSTTGLVPMFPVFPASPVNFIRSVRSEHRGTWRRRGRGSSVCAEIHILVALTVLLLPVRDVSICIKVYSCVEKQFMTINSPPVLTRQRKKTRNPRGYEGGPRGGGGQGRPAAPNAVLRRIAKRKQETPPKQHPQTQHYYHHQRRHQPSYPPRRWPRSPGASCRPPRTPQLAAAGPLPPLLPPPPPPPAGCHRRHRGGILGLRRPRPGSRGTRKPTCDCVPYRTICRRAVSCNHRQAQRFGEGGGAELVTGTTT